MNIGFISGTGKEGKALAIRFGMHGHSIVIGSRSKEKSEKTVQEMKEVMQAIGKDVTNEEVLHMMEFVDDDGSGEIDFDEFVKLMERSTNTENAKAIQENKEISRDWRTAFDIFDADRDGLLSAEDLASSLKSFGRVLSRAEAQAMIDDVDVNNNGCITLNEFINKLESIRTNISSQQC